MRGICERDPSIKMEKKRGIKGGKEGGGCLISEEIVDYMHLSWGISICHLVAPDSNDNF